MARKKKKKDEEGGGDGWLATFSDMITLLLCFFAILFNPDSNKPVVIKAISTYFANMGFGVSLTPGQMKDLGNTIASLPSATRGKVLGDALKRAISLFQPEIRSNKVKVTQDERGIVISLASDMFFAPASAVINIESARSTLLNLATLLASDEVAGRKFRIEGHTDSTPIDPSGPWSSNWQLSGERALSVLTYLSALGIPENRMQYAGFGSTVPVSSDDTPEGRAYNRRVDVVIIDDAHL